MTKEMRVDKRKLLAITLIFAFACVYKYKEKRKCEDVGGRMTRYDGCVKH